MRHKKSNKRLGRTHEHRKAMFRNMARSLLTYERIRTTETKAKEVRKVVDRLISLALANDLHARRQAYKVLNNHQLVQKLFDEIGPRFAGGGGGYTRIVKLAVPRAGDCAPLAVIELTRREGEEAPAAEKKPAAKAEAPKKEAPKKASPEKVEEPAEELEEKAEAAPEEAPAEEPPAEEVAAEEAPAEDAPEEEAPAEEPAEKK